jgi:hypothetical protein
MAKADILVPRNKEFEKRVQRLAKEGSQIVETYAQLTERMLRFASAFKEATDEAHSLDEGADGIHAQYLRDTLAESIQTTNASIWSRWNTIGTYADKLLEYADSIPPQRDGLYELALAVKEKRPIQKWIEGEKITVETTVREIRALRKPKQTSSKKTIATQTKKMNAGVTLYFRTYTDAASVLEKLIFSDEKFEISSDKAFAEALKGNVGLDAFEDIKHRFR